MMIHIERDVLDQVAEDVLKASHLVVECDTCGRLFLFMPCYDFMAKTRMWVTHPNAGPDRWAVQTLLHWMNDYDHEIFFKWPLLPPNSISEVWRRLWEEQGAFLPEKVQRYIDETRQLLI